MCSCLIQRLNTSSAKHLCFKQGNLRAFFVLTSFRFLYRRSLFFSRNPEERNTPPTKQGLILFEGNTLQHNIWKFISLKFTLYSRLKLSSNSSFRGQIFGNSSSHQVIIYCTSLKTSGNFQTGTLFALTNSTVSDFSCVVKEAEIHPVNRFPCFLVCKLAAAGKKKHTKRKSSKWASSACRKSPAQKAAVGELGVYIMSVLSIWL